MGDYSYVDAALITESAGSMWPTGSSATPKGVKGEEDHFITRCSKCDELASQRQKT